MIKIISCFWNASKYIEKCISSIKNQTLKDYKVFLVDDISTDNTIEIIQELVKDDDRFVLIKNEEKNLNSEIWMSL